MTAKNPSTTFYFNDWENDDKLKACSLAAQGLWMRLLCIAARSPERGIVQIGDLNLSLPDGLAHLALAVGRPLEEIAPLIDELVSSGAASVDRKKRIYNRRMVALAKLSAVRSKAGKKGAEATHGKIMFIPSEPSKSAGKPPPSSRPPDFESSSHKPSPGSAASASASPDGPPRSPLPESAKWAERLAGYRPWEGTRTWRFDWGPPPDSLQRPSFIPAAMHRTWLDEYAAAKARGEAA